MSVEAITWALKQPVADASTKFVLVILANCADGSTFVAYPSVAYIASATALNRKTVLRSIHSLVELGFIKDTGQRSGVTRSVIAYELAVEHPRGVVVPFERLPVPSGNSEAVPELGPLLNEAVPKLGPLNAGQAVPIHAVSSPNSRDKQSLNWDTETKATTATTAKAKAKAEKLSRRASLAALVLPDDVNPESWNAFVEMRELKAPLTERAARMVITQLIRLREQGHDPNDVLDQSTRSSWRDVYAMRKQGDNGNGRQTRESLAQRIERKSREDECRARAVRLDDARALAPDGLALPAPLDRNDE